jgi:hypothetical protein
MSGDPHGVRDIPVGTPVIGFDGTLLGHVREVYPHYILVHQEGQHTDLEVPVHAIRGFEEGKLRVSVKRDSVTEVDDEETAHRMGEERP